MEPITIGEQEYRVQWTLRRDQVFLCKDPQEQDVVVKSYNGSEPLFARGLHAFEVWKEVRDQLMAVGFPDFVLCKDYYRVTQFLPGTSAKELLLMHRFLTIQQAHRLAIMAIPAFRALMNNGISHGDIKPDNIVLSPGDPDSFSSMSFIDPDYIIRHTELFPNLGPYNRYVFSTPHYIPPEVCKNQYSRTSDLFSFALSIFEISFNPQLLFHVMPILYCSETPNDYLRMRQNGSWRHFQFESILREHMKRITAREDCAHALDQLLNFTFQCLKDDPTARPQSAEEIEQILTDTGNLTEV